MRCSIALLALGLVSTFSTAQSQTGAPQSAATASAGTASTPATTASATSTASPEFEAATIKPVKEPDPNRMNDRTDGRRYTTRNTTLRDLILMAYGVDRQQTAGGPAWIATDEYDVDAVGDGIGKQDGNQMVWQEMLQGLLADRFKLTFHWEQREISSYELVVAKGGPKLKAADANEKQGSGCTRLGECAFRRDPLQHFARWMGYGVLDRPVVDKTGLAGEFDFTLQWTPDETQFAGMGIHVPPPVDNPNAPPGLFTAIEEQLGLRLEPQRIPSELPSSSTAPNGLRRTSGKAGTVVQRRLGALPGGQSHRRRFARLKESACGAVGEDTIRVACLHLPNQPTRCCRRARRPTPGRTGRLQPSAARCPPGR